MSKHTPGPWRLADCGKHRPGDEAWKRCAHIATIDGPLPTTLANMQLKAAAPDLLEACTLALGIMEQTNRVNVPPMAKFITVDFAPEDVAALRAAIAKAKGETT